ncbi:MAG: hypothetical protein KF886_03920 [Candidatus Hydrogenedentes bacterium]|nr:hypothetical protein [Candidatus Hydrogenedentota bacterium]
MKKILQIALNALRVFLRVFMPDLAQRMDAEGQFQVEDDAANALEEANYMLVEDRGAPVTIVVFSGLDVLYAGLARFEFQGVLRRIDFDANLVFLRDCQRAAFFVAPDGSPGGHAFYEDAINRVLGRLGAAHNIALGSSIGGTAAIIFGTRCNFHHIISFGAPFELDVYTRPRRLMTSIFDFKKFFTEPAAYWEMLLVTSAAIWGVRHILRRAQLNAIPDFAGAYRARPDRPHISAFYGETAWPDVEQAQYLKDIPEVSLHPLPTGRHNTPVFLKKTGAFESTMAAEITRHYRPEGASGTQTFPSAKNVG